MRMPPCVNFVYCTRTMTLSLRPPASMTVSRRNPGPSGCTKTVPRRAVLLKRNAVHQHRQVPGATGELDGQRSGFPCPAQIDAGAIGRKDNAGRIGQLTDCRGRPEALQRQRQLAARRKERALRRGGKRDRRITAAGKSIEQDRRRGRAPNKTRHRYAIRPPDPHADCHAAVKADRPGVTKAVGGTGLERDPAMRRMLRGRRTEQRITDVPGGDRIEQALRACLRGVGSLGQWRRIARHSRHPDTAW